MICACKKVFKCSCQTQGPELSYCYKTSSRDPEPMCLNYASGVKNDSAQGVMIYIESPLYGEIFKHLLPGTV